MDQVRMDGQDVDRISALERCAILESQEMLDELDLSQPPVPLDDMLLDDITVEIGESRLQVER